MKSKKEAGRRHVFCTGNWDPAPIEGRPGERGELVFWVGNGLEPWWLVEWTNNGSCYAIVNAAGVIGTAGAEELTRDFRLARGR